MKKILLVCAATLVAASSFSAAKAPDAKAKKKDPGADVNTPRPDARSLSFDVREGTAPDLGSVEAGKLADIHNTAKIRWVIKNGAVYEAETMKQLWPEEKPLPPFFWQSGS